VIETHPCAIRTSQAPKESTIQDCGRDRNKQHKKMERDARETHLIVAITSLGNNTSVVGMVLVVTMLPSVSNKKLLQFLFTPISFLSVLGAGADTLCYVKSVRLYIHTSY
jgi:hypothetical protein